MDTTTLTHIADVFSAGIFLAVVYAIAKADPPIEPPITLERTSVADMAAGVKPLIPPAIDDESEAGSWDDALRSPPWTERDNGDGTYSLAMQPLLTLIEVSRKQ